MKISKIVFAGHMKIFLSGILLILTVIAILMSVILYFLTNNLQNAQFKLTTSMLLSEGFIGKNDLIIHGYTNWGLDPPDDLIEQASGYLVNLGRFYGRNLDKTQERQLYYKQQENNLDLIEKNNQFVTTTLRALQHKTQTQNNLFLYFVVLQIIQAIVTLLLVFGDRSKYAHHQNDN